MVRDERHDGVELVIGTETTIWYFGVYIQSDANYGMDTQRFDRKVQYDRDFGINTVHAQTGILKYWICLLILLTFCGGYLNFASDIKSRAVAQYLELVETDVTGQVLICGISFIT